MSLLMDALKQAETVKRGTKQEKQTPSTPTANETPPLAETPVAEPAGPNAELSLTPVDPVPEQTGQDAEPFDPMVAPETIGSAPDEPAEATTSTTTETPAPAPQPSDSKTATTEEILEIVLEHAVPEPPTPAAPLNLEPASTDTSAQAADRVLAVSEARMVMQRRRWWFGIAGLCVIMLLAIGGYHYTAMLSHTRPQMLVPHLPGSDTLDAATVDVAAEDVEHTQPTQAAGHAAPAYAEPDSGWQPAPVDARVLRGEPLSLAGEEPPAAMAQPASPRAAIRISRGTRSDRVSDSLQNAYMDYQVGRYTQAAAGYRQVLAAEPGNRDARLGLAALATRRGEIETARMLYRELLRRDPRDSAAQAGLASLQDAPSTDTESDLKNLLAEQPQSAPLHFALANLYAAQARWPLAQQAYFEAQRLAPQHPDYAFNLAVGLEHLGQAQPALEYYRRALSLATRYPSGFDVAIAEQRVRALEKQTQP